MDSVLINKLPKYLKDDINRVMNFDRKDPFYDCYLDEVYGSINSALCDGAISSDEADYLRKHYFFDILDKGAIE